jgi:hypothetical protein
MARTSSLSADDRPGWVLTRERIVSERSTERDGWYLRRAQGGDLSPVRVWLHARRENAERKARQLIATDGTDLAARMTVRTSA